MELLEGWNPNEATRQNVEHWAKRWREMTRCDLEPGYLRDRIHIAIGREVLELSNPWLGDDGPEFPIPMTIERVVSVWGHLLSSRA